MLFSVFLPEFLFFIFNFFFISDMHGIIFKRTLRKYPLKAVIAAFDTIILNIHHRTTCSFNGRGWESSGQQNNIT